MMAFKRSITEILEVFSEKNKEDSSEGCLLDSLGCRGFRNHKTEVTAGGIESDGSGAVLGGIEVGEGDGVGGPGLEVGAGFYGVDDAGGVGGEGESEGIAGEGRGRHVAVQVCVGIEVEGVGHEEGDAISIEVLI